MSDRPFDDETEARFVAAIDLVRRTGALSTEIRWSDDEEPTVWFVVVEYNVGPDGVPRPPGEEGETRYEAAAGMDPMTAALRLAELQVDGSMCVHCGRPSGVEVELDAPPLEDVVCWYQYDPELKTFRRGCEGG